MLDWKTFSVRCVQQTATLMPGNERPLSGARKQRGLRMNYSKFKDTKTLYMKTTLLQTKLQSPSHKTILHSNQYLFETVISPSLVACGNRCL